jgi:hypothetical protein
LSGLDVPAGQVAHEAPGGVDANWPAEQTSHWREDLGA